MLTDEPQVKAEDTFRRKVRAALVKRGCPADRLDAEVEKVMAAGRNLRIDIGKIVAGL